MNVRIYALVGSFWFVAVSHAYDFTWLTTFPTNSSVNAVAREPKNRAVVAGTFSGTAQFGTNLLASVGDSDVFIAGLDQEGKITWARQAGGVAGEGVTRVAIAWDGTTFFCGTFSGTATFGTNVVTATSTNGYPDLYIARLGSAGEFLWVRTYAGGGTGSALALFTPNRVWLTGDAYGALFLRSYDFNGDLISHIAPTASESQGAGIVTDTNGNVYVTGFFKWSLDFGSTNFTGSGAGNAFTAKFTPAGALLWAATYSPVNRSLGYDIALAPNGDVVTVGHTDATYLGAPAPTLFLWKLSASGNEIWLRQQGERRSVYTANRLAIDSRGSIYTFGKKTDPFTNPDPRSGPLLTAWTSNGTEAVFLRIFGAHPGEDGSGSSITVDAAGNAWLGGAVQGTFDFGTNHIVATNGLNFVAKLTSVMQPRLAIQPGTNANTVLVSWPAAATGFQLRISDQLPATNWASVGVFPITVSNRAQVTLAATNPIGYLELQAP